MKVHKKIGQGFCVSVCLCVFVCVCESECTSVYVHVFGSVCDLDDAVAG